MIRLKVKGQLTHNFKFAFDTGYQYDFKLASELLSQACTKLTDDRSFADDLILLALKALREENLGRFIPSGIFKHAEIAVYKKKGID